MTAIARRFVAVDGRVVHLRRAGSGPPLLLVHQSPRSSEELVPLIRLLAADFDVIAPDTPGNGLSDPLGTGGSGLAAYADALAQLLGTLGIARLPAYGYHTGAAMVAALAARHPGRVAAAVLNGLPAFAAADVALIRRQYLPPFLPAWDGSHLAWAWARLREQTIFFPWFDGRPAARMAFDIPPPDALDAALVDLCRAGDSYRAPYEAAFSDSGPQLAAAIRCPVAIVATERDPLRPHLATFVGSGRRVEQLEPGLDPVCRLISELVREGRGAESAPVDAAEPPAMGLVGEPGSQIAWRLGGTGSGRPRLLIHPEGEDSTIALAQAGPFAPDLLLAVDRPGHGASDPGDESSFRAALAELGHGDPTRHSTGWSEERRRAEVEVFAPADFAGGHLARLWHRARDGLLFDPWYDRRASAAIADAPGPAPADVQQRFLASLIAAPALRRTLSVPPTDVPPQP